MQDLFCRSMDGGAWAKPGSWSRSSPPSPGQNPAKPLSRPAWSIGEVRRVYEALKEIESGSSEPENR